MACRRPLTSSARWYLLAGLLTGCGDDGRDTTAGMTGVTITGVTATGVTATGVTATDPTGITATDPTGDDATATDPDPTSAGPTSEPTASDPTADPTTTPGDACLEDADCPAGQHCGEFSGECLPEGGCAFDEDCDGGQDCVDGQCQIGGECGSESFGLTKVVPNVMIVLDRSGSMGDDVQDSNKNRWGVAKDAIAQLVNTFDAEIRFGLVTYSACIPGQECSAGDIVVPVGNLAAGPINGFLGGKGDRYLCNSGDPETSTGNTLDALIGEPTLQDPTRTNAVLLITDGNENGECKSNTDAAMAASALFGQAISVPTYAVGFSNDILGSLAEVAQNGGTGQPYNANNPQSLQDALGAIAGNVVSCSFVLDGDPPDEDELYVFFDDDPAGVPMDPANGWTYDPATGTLTFHGAACEALKSGSVVDIDVVFGCNTPIPG